MNTNTYERDSVPVGNALRGVPLRRRPSHLSSFLLHPLRRSIRRLTPPARLASLRRSFTLVELLLVMMLIALLASMTLFAMHGVMEDARAARSQAQVAKINELIMDKWEAFQTRPVRVNLPPNTNPTLIARARLYALREIMRLELPDRKTDVDNAGANDAFIPGQFLPARPALSQRYQRAALPSWTPAYQGAECLYLIVAATQDGDSNGLDFFKSSEIGDFDNDGMKEILDGWGYPIEFIRWPSGYESPLQPMPRDPVAYPDSFDPLKVDPRWSNNSAAKPFAMFPLIFSAGRDRVYDIAIEVTTNAGGVMRYNNLPLDPPYVFGPNDPYCSANPSGNAVGQRLDVQGPPGSPPGPNGRIEYFDNITNHLTGTN